MLFYNHEVTNGIFSIDFETANDYQNSECSVGIVRFVDGEEKDSVYSLIKPAKMYFRPVFIDIHEISYGDVRNSPQSSFLKSGRQLLKLS